MGIQFFCVDCDRRLPAVRESQVIFGRQPPRTGRGLILVGRCIECGAGLPVISVHENWIFRWNETGYRIGLGFDMHENVFCYVLSRQVIEQIEFWQPIRTFPTRELRSAIAYVARSPVSYDEVLDMKLAATEWPDAMFWRELVGN